MESQDSLVERVAMQAPSWRRLKFGEKAAILRECIDAVAVDCKELSLKSVSEGLKRAQKISDNPLAESESNFLALFLILNTTTEMNRLIYMLESLERTGTPPKPVSMKKVENVDVFQVYPLVSADKSGILNPGAAGLVGEMWTTHGCKQKFPDRSDLGDEPGITVVLGAGNYENLAMVDTLDRMFLHNEVVILKHHPLRPHLYPVYNKILEPLIKRGYFAAVVDTGLSTTQQLIYHPLTRHIHLTGGGPTHDGIISSAPDGKLKASFTSELGCVTPWLVVPTSTNLKGNEDWNETTIQHHVKNLVRSMKINGSASCNAPKVLILAKEWSQKDLFMKYVRKEIAEIKASQPYYPGHESRFERFMAEYKEDFELIVAPSATPGEVVNNGLLHVKLGPQNKGGNRYGLENEAFTPVLAIAELDCSAGTGKDLTSRFLQVAPRFCNEECFGSLSCTVLAPPAVPEASLESAIAALQYGNVTVNAWSGTGGYGCPQITWGAYPGLYGGVGKSGSGSGVVMNTMLFEEDKILKSVGRAPFISPQLQLVDDLPPAFVIEILYETCRKPTLGGQIWAVMSLFGSKLTNLIGCAST